MVDQINSLITVRTLTWRYQQAADISQADGSAAATTASSVALAEATATATDLGAAGERGNALLADGADDEKVCWLFEKVNC